MIQDIEKIEYCHGLLEKGKQATDLPVKVWRSSQINAEIIRSLHNEDILNLGGVYGNKDMGDPPEYDHLRIVLTDDEVQIEFFNRGISLLTADSETYRRIHRFLCVLDKHIAN